MEELKKIRVILAELLRTQKLAVLSTVSSDGSAYSNLVSFAAPRPENLLFATTRATRKYANLKQNAQVALLIDNRRNDEADFHEAAAATALGRAVELADAERTAGLVTFLARFPFLAEFVHSPSCALFRVDVERFIVVTKFQNVVEVRTRP
jgi:nitroimidazol reductase NimA-like FMN-containing flavoprotein (pyridoxamine 5'-phosphate oxidase superfamily)